MLAKNQKVNKISKSSQKKVSTRKKSGQIDYIFLALVIVLLTVGLVALFSASFANALRQHGDSYKFISRQLIYGIGGVGCMLFISQIDYRFLNKSKIVWSLYLLTIVLLIAVYFFDPINGARRWITVGAGGSKITFQPSELAKFTIAVVLAHLIDLNHHRMNTNRYGVLPPMVALIPIVLLVIFEVHVSATIVLVAIAGVMLFVGGVDIKWFLVLGAVLYLGMSILAESGKIHYLLPRFEVWKDPYSDAMDLGWQIIQSLIAIGSGGLMGEGIGGSNQKYNNLLPELQNDYIFSIVCEEVGFIGATIILLLFALLVWRGFKIATQCEDRFGSLLAIGLTAQVGIQTILNVLVVTNTIPPTGISLPFFSAGGTSLIMLLAQMGVVLSISKFSGQPETYIETELILEEE